VHATCSDPGFKCGYFCSVIQELKEKRQALELPKFNIFYKKQTQNNATETSDEPVPSTESQ